MNFEKSNLAANPIAGIIILFWIHPSTLSSFHILQKDFRQKSNMIGRVKIGEASLEKEDKKEVHFSKIFAGKK